MKELYPTSAVWPYVLAGVVAITCIVAPTDWQEYGYQVFLKSKEYVQHRLYSSKRTLRQQSSKVVVAFDPVEQAKQAKKEAEMAPMIASVAMDSSPRQPVTSPTGKQDDGFAAKPVTTSIGRADAQVWIPPHDWTPRPIIPLADDDPRLVREGSLNTTKPGDELPSFEHGGLVLAEIQPPVAAFPKRKHPPLQASKEAIESARLPDSTASDSAVPEDDRVVLLNEVDSNDTVFDFPTINVKLGKPSLLPNNVEELKRKNPANELDASLISTGETKQSIPAQEIAQQETERPITPKDRDQVADVDQTPPIDVANHPKHAWPASAVLLDLIEKGEEIPSLSTWSQQLRSILQQLEATEVTGEAVQWSLLRELQDHIRIAIDTSEFAPEQQTLYRRIRLGCERRLAVWTPLLQMVAQTTSVELEKERLSSTARQLTQDLARIENAAPWVPFLRLNDLAGKSPDLSLVETVLFRLHTPGLNAEQRAFLNSELFRSLEEQLRIVVARSIHAGDLMSAVERYEAEPTRLRADELTSIVQRWRSSPTHEDYATTITAMITHYRNANLRVSISEDIVNRFVPAVHQYVEAVNDRILGADVRGRSSTRSNLEVRLVPDNQAIRLGIVARGNVQSNTTSRKGPVTLHNRSHSSFSADKELIVRPRGIELTKTKTQANSNTRLVGLQSDWDTVPIIGGILRNLARQQHEEQRGRLRAETLWRVRRKTEQKMDDTLNNRVTQVENHLNEKLIAPLRRLSLDPTALEMKTTDTRAILRTRLASPYQFAAHTPRPNARTDSLLSFQIHQSAANNLIEQMELHGRRMTLSELMDTLSKRLQLETPLQVPNEDYRDAIVQFADHHPFEFEFHDGQISLTINFAYLQAGRRAWKDFSVRGYYRANVEQLNMAFARKDGIELIGQKIGLRDQIALRGIFSKVLAKQTNLHLLRDIIQKQPELQQLELTQLAIRDGWIGISLGDRAELASSPVLLR